MDKGLLIANVGAAIGAIGVVGAAMVGKRRIRNSERDSIKRDIEIHNMLPEASLTRAALLKRIDENINDFLIAGRTVRRNIQAIISSLLIISMSAGLQIYLVHALVNFTTTSGTQQVLALLLVIAYCVGGFLFQLYSLITLVDAVPKRLRDENGRPVIGLKDKHN